MRMCSDHWQRLRTAVSSRGLDQLIAPDGAAAAEIMRRQIEGKDTPLDFDPLMSAHNQLAEIAMNFVGVMQVMSGEQCPVCLLEKYDWCDGAAHQSRLFAEKNGLLLEEPSQ